MKTYLRILLSASVGLSTFSAVHLQAQPPGPSRPPAARGDGMQDSRSSHRARTPGGAGKPVAVSVVTSKGVDGKPEVITLTGRLVQNFQYQIGSFKPVELLGPELAAAGMMGMADGMGSSMMADPAMGGSIMPGGAAGGGSMGGGMGGSYEGRMMGGGGVPEDGSAASHPPRLRILAIALDEPQEDGRANIELLTAFYGMDHGFRDSMGMGMDMGMEGDPSAPMHIGTYHRLADLAKQADGPDVHLTPEEFQIVSQMCRLKIWKADAVRAIQVEEHASEAALMAEKEQHLKQLLSEEFDVQLARQEYEVRTIEQRTAALKQEIERRRQAKERVIDVQLGRIVLEAQGLLGR